MKKLVLVGAMGFFLMLVAVMGIVVIKKNHQLTKIERQLVKTETDLSNVKNELKETKEKLNETEEQLELWEENARRKVRSYNQTYDRMEEIVIFLAGGNPVTSQKDGHQLSWEEARCELAELLYGGYDMGAIFPELVLPKKIFGETKNGYLLLEGVIDGAPAIYSIRIK